MTARTLEDLREALFDTLQGVRKGEIDLEEARAINELGKTLTDTAKVEVEYLRATGGGESAFIPAIGRSNLPETATQTEGLPNGISTITRHRLAG